MTITPKRGIELLQDPSLNKSTAFTEAEKQAFGIVGLIPDITETEDLQLRRVMMQLGHKIRRWRLLGASALELCYIGAGRIDGFVDLRGTLRVTDAAAGMLVCTEAGGKVSDLNGDPLNFPEEVTVGRCIIATNGVLHHKVIEYLR